MESWFVSVSRWAAGWRRRLGASARQACEDWRRVWQVVVFPGIHLLTMALLIYIAIALKGHNGIFFTREAVLHRLVHVAQTSCSEYDELLQCRDPGGEEKGERLWEGAWLHQEDVLEYISTQVHNIFIDQEELTYNLGHTDLVGNLTIRQYRVKRREGQKGKLPGIVVSPEWAEELQDLTPPNSSLLPFPSYYHKRAYRASTHLYDSTPHAHVLLSAKEATSGTIGEVYMLVLERVAALRATEWLDEATRALVVQFALHKQDDNLFLHVSLAYEKVGDFWLFSSSLLIGRLTAFFFYPNEAAIQQYAQTDKKLFQNARAHLVATFLTVVLALAIFQLVFETTHIWRLRLLGNGCRIFFLNVCQVALQTGVLLWAYNTGRYLQEAVDQQGGNFHHIDVEPLLMRSGGAARAVVVQLLVLLLKQLLMPGYFLPVIDDLLRRYRNTLPSVCLALAFLTLPLLLFGALMVSRLHTHTLLPATLHVFATIIADPKYDDYGFLFFPLVVVFVLLVMPLVVAIIVEGDQDPPTIQEDGVVVGPVTPSQLRRWRLRREVREMVEKFLR